MEQFEADIYRKDLGSFASNISTVAAMHMSWLSDNTWGKREIVQI